MYFKKTDCFDSRHRVAYKLAIFEIRRVAFAKQKKRSFILQNESLLPFRDARRLVLI